MIRSFEDLEIWQLAVELAKIIYQITRDFPKEEKYSLTSQIKDSAVSVSANIAEGFGRYHYKDKIKFYYNSRGSLLETKSHLIIADQLGFINSTNQSDYKTALNLIDKIGIKLNNYISSVGTVND